MAFEGSRSLSLNVMASNAMADVAHQQIKANGKAKQEDVANSHDEGDDEYESDLPSPRRTRKQASGHGHGAQSAAARGHNHVGVTPSGIPRLMSYGFSRTASSRTASHDVGGSSHNHNHGYYRSEDEDNVNVDPESSKFVRTNSEFRGGLDFVDAEQREKEREAAEKRGRDKRISLAARRFFTFSDDGAQTYDSPNASQTSLHRPGGSRQASTQGHGAGNWTAPTSPVNTHKPIRPAFSGLADRVTRSQSLPPNAQDQQGERGAGSGGGGVTDGDQEQDGDTERERDTDDKRGRPRKKAVPREGNTTTNTAQRWAKLRAFLPKQAGSVMKDPITAVASPQVNITDELLVGGLSSLLMRMYFERDESDHRRVPILLHRLRVRVSDSLHPLKGGKAVFRIECEYANGAVRWVIYRQLRDFISLHTHYRLSNAYNRNIEAMPDFPKTSLPYFNFLNKKDSDTEREKDKDKDKDKEDALTLAKEDGHANGKGKGKEKEKSDTQQPVSRAEFARKQREELEKYLLKLIRTVMFHPTSNRLCKFLEISALSISLAHSGGHQMKAGLLKVEGVSPSNGAWARRNAGWREKKKARWTSIRESYLVAVEDPGELEIWDCWLLDSEFRIERPKRYYRFMGAAGVDFEKGKNLIEEKVVVGGKGGVDVQVEDKSAGHGHEGSGTISKLSKFLHLGHSHKETELEDATRPVAARADSSSSSDSSRPPTPLLDPSTNVNPMHPTQQQLHDNKHENDHDTKHSARQKADTSKHTFFIINSQSRLKCTARNERQMQQWIAALERIGASSHWSGTNRFNSFAPIRLNVAAQWLVDGRDYFWNFSRAISLAKERIYIHDWWLSPELELRRPGKPNWRLDRLLQRKAREGVMIYIIIYNEVSDKTTPTDSNYAKQTLMNLHENILVQRSPSHLQTGTFFWAHHEKLCVVDEAIAFMGGLDACFGRWDTAQHILIDDPESKEDVIWHGKDFSNPRIGDFHALNKPHDDMYDRGKVPRMPWHDVSMQIVGQPARDLCRHFIQRWNYLLRIKNHKRKMPFLLPPPEFRTSELEENGLLGTCELQICRSAGPWSMGTTMKSEHSIQDAYLKAIQLSQHFVYIENQFFITSTVAANVQVENKIGDAIVERAIRAHREGTKWKACIVIPLLPGFTNPVDHGDASAIRIIMECQNRTISRGPHSIFSRLRKEEIDPDDYIAVFSLRGWGKLRGNVLTTEEVYIHAKVCIVDDQLAIIGSANINERSQRGDRDSELAAVIRDTDMIDSTMDGKPFRVGRFAHTLRVRLMREHLGVDVDAMYQEDLMQNNPKVPEHEQEKWDPDKEQKLKEESGITRIASGKKHTPLGNILSDAKDTASQILHGTGKAEAKDLGRLERKVGVKGKQTDVTATDKQLKEERMTYTRDGKKVEGFASAQVPTLEEKTVAEHRPPGKQADDKPILDQVDEEAKPDGESSHRPGQEENSPQQPQGEENGPQQPQGEENGPHKPQGEKSSPQKPQEVEVKSPVDDTPKESVSASKDDGEEAKAKPDPSADDVHPDRLALFSTDSGEGKGDAKGEPEQARVHDGSGELYGAPADASKDAKTDDQFPHSRSGVNDPSEQEKEAVPARAILRKHLSPSVGTHPWTIPVPGPDIDPHGMEDPICEKFWDNIWTAAAVHNTEIYRKVFHAIPDDLVTTWKQYKEFILHHERLSKPIKEEEHLDRPDPVARMPSEAGSKDDPGERSHLETEADNEAKSPSLKSEQQTIASNTAASGDLSRRSASSSGKKGERAAELEEPAPTASRIPSKADEPFQQWERDEMEKLLTEVRGHLVVYPHRFLEGEDAADNFLFNSDRYMPMAIYN